MNNLTKGTLKINPVLNCESLVRNQSNYSDCKAALLILIKLFTSCSSSFFHPCCSYRSSSCRPSCSCPFLLFFLIIFILLSLFFVVIFVLFIVVFSVLFLLFFCISFNRYWSVHLLLVVFLKTFSCSSCLFCPYCSFSVDFILVIVSFLVLLFILFL